MTISGKNTGKFLRLFLIAVGSSLALSCVVGLLLAQETFDLLTRSEGDGGLEIRLSENGTPARTNNPVIDVLGYTTMPSYVELFLENEPVGRTTTDDVPYRFDGDQRPNRQSFDFQVALKPGPNNLSVRARPLPGWGRAGDFAELTHRIEWAPEETAEPRLWGVPRVVNSERLRLAGSAFPGSTVLIRVVNAKKLDRPPASDEPKAAQADDQGRFEAEVVFPSSGDYSITARNTTEGEHPDAPPATRVTYDPAFSRKATVAVDYDKTTIDLEVTLSKGNRDIDDLLSGHTTLPQFIHAVHGLHINNSPVAYRFRGVTPDYTVAGSKVTVKASTVSNRSEALPVIKGVLEFHAGFGEKSILDAQGDRLTLKVKDYNVEAYAPQPASIEDGAAVWSPGLARQGGRQRILVYLAYNPVGTPASFFRLFSLSPYQIFNYKVTSVFALTFSLLYTIPFLWALWLIERHRPHSLVGERYVERFKRLSLFLTGIVLMYPAQRIADELESSLHPVFNALVFRWRLPSFVEPIEPLRLIVSTLIFMAAFVALLFTLRLLIKHDAARFVLKALGRAFVSASLMNVAIYLVFFGIYYCCGDAKESYLPTTLIVLPFILLILFRVRHLLKADENLGPQVSGKLVVAVFVVLAVALAYPAGKNVYSVDSYEFSTWIVTTGNVRYFFGLIQDLMHYVLFVALLPFLIGVRREEANVHPFVVALGLLLFSSYLVGTTPNWFVLPLPFLIALKVYPLYVRAPLDEVAAINAVQARVFETRRKMLLDFFELTNARQFVQSVDQLRNKVASGDMSPADFVKRKGEIETHAAEMEKLNRVTDELNTEDVVLGVGPFESNLENGLHALKRGLVIVLPFLILFLWTLLQELRVESPFLPLWLFTRLATFVLDWAVSAFFFGYFFTQLRGESGVKKGLYVALALIVCFVPVWLTSGSSSVQLSATFLRAGQIFLFFTVLGVWAFDYYTFRKVLRERFTWRRFTRLGDMPSFTAVASVLVSSAGVAVSTVLNGQFTTVVAELVGVLFPQLPGPPTK